LALFAFASIVQAEQIQIGSKLGGFELEDQFGQPHSIKRMPRTLILTFEKKTGAFVNQFLTRQGSQYLAEHDALYIADIARMPGFVTTMFALPKMRKYTHTILLAYGEDFQKHFPIQTGMATVIHFDPSSRVTDFVFVSNEEELQKEIMR